jgi:polyisoprenoid-binding protein YceI
MLKLSLPAFIVAAAFPLAALATDYAIDSSHTYPHFSVSHLGFSTMQGRFDKTTGTIYLDRAAKKGSIDITIEVASISTGFAKRDKHLRGPDFFNSAEFPTITYKSTKMNFKNDVPVSVEGNLTMAGASKPVTLNIDSFKCGMHPMKKKEMCGAAASAQLKRSYFGIKYGLPAVGDDIKLVFEIEALKK